MSAKLIFVKRSQEEINIFGGQVFADVDGRNVATIEKEIITIEVSAGTHLVKMYKSHEYGSMIGFAESEVTVADGEALVFRYSPPMVVTQPGHITISDFTSYEQIEREVNNAARVMAQEKQANDEKIKKQAKTISANYWFWIILIVIVPTVIWFIYELILWDSIF